MNTTHLLAGLALAALLSGCPTTSEPPADPEPVAPTTGALNVQLQDPDGLSIVGGFVTVGPLGIEALSDDDGLAQFPSLPPGTWRVTAAAAGFDPTVVEAVQVQVGLTVELELTLAVDGDSVLPALRVELSTAAGRPLVGATVSVDDGAWVALTGDDGRASLPGLPVGDLRVQILPNAATSASPWSSELRFVDGASTLLTLSLSGAPGANATWIGSDGCAACHAADHGAWAASRHARTWSQSPPAALAALLDEGLTVPVAVSNVASVQVRLARSGGVDRATLYGSTGAATWDVLGWYGADNAVPLLALPDGPVPGPVVWRPEGLGDLASPAFEAGLVGFHPEVWFDVGGRLRSHHDTDGPAPADMEAAGCLGCHAVGLDINEGGGVVRAFAIAERGVGCEACHGPGSEHALAGNDPDGGVELIVNPGRLDPVAAMDVCAACHSAGLAAASAPFEVDVAFPYADHDAWQPGRVLADYFLSSPVLWPSGAPAGPNQQADALAASPHGGSGLYALGCGECHGPHGASGDAPHQLLAPSDDNSLCLGCHLALHFEDTAGAAAHTRHSGYDPAGPYASGRCTGCHMPPTASRDERSALTGGGRLASHGFAALPPATTLSAFDALGNAALPLDAVPPNSCLTCHRWAEERYDAVGIDFHGPAGEPTLRTTYVTLSAVYALLFGEDP